MADPSRSGPIPADPATVGLGARIDPAREPNFHLVDALVSPATCEVVAGSRRVTLQYRVMQVLVALARSRGEVVSRGALVASCWDTVAVSDDAINRCIQRLRRLAETEIPGAYVIETLPRIGYRLTPGAAGPPLAAPPLPSKPSIAVIPFANLSNDPKQDYLAEGMVEEIVEALARYKSLSVIGPGLSFKDRAISAQDAGRRLGVRYVLDGSVRKSGERVRVAVKLTDAADGAQIWAHRFDDTLEDVFALQDKVAGSVAGAIEPTVQAAEGRKAAARSTTDTTSYGLYLRGWKLAWNLDRSDVNEALDLLNRAIERDPNHARALAATAACHGEVYALLWSDDVDRHRRLGLSLSHRALRLAPDDPEVLAWCGFVLWCMRDDLQAAIALIDRALALNPSLAFAWLASGHLRTQLGQADLAAEHFETALRLDPLSALRHWALTGLGVARLMQGQMSEAIALLRESAQLCAGSPMNYAILAACLGHLGQIAEARDALARFEAASGVTAERWVRWAELNDFVLTGIALAEGKTLEGD